MPMAVNRPFSIVQSVVALHSSLVSKKNSGVDTKQFAGSSCALKAHIKTIGLNITLLHKLVVEYKVLYEKLSDSG